MNIYCPIEVEADTILPAISCPGALIATCDISEQPAYADLNAFIAAGGTVSDNYGIDSTSFVMLSEVSDNNTCPEIVTRTYEIADSCGNVITCTQIITIDDNIVPVFTTPSDTTLYLDAACLMDTTTASIGTVTVASDNCTAVPIITYEDDGTNLSGCNTTGSFTRIWTVRDGCGNVTIQTQTVAILDTLAPSFTTPSDTIVYLDASCLVDTTIASIGTITDTLDNCGFMTVVYADDLTNLSGCNSTGTFERTWTVTDACGNATTGIQTVSISDTLAPIFTVPADTTLYLDAVCFVDTTTTSIGTATGVSDACTAAPIITYVDDETNLSGCNATGSFTRTWTVTDDCGNATIQTQTVAILDTLAPSFTIPSDTIVYLDASCLVDTTIASIGTITDTLDNCGFMTVVYADDLTNLSGCNSTGTFERTWTVTDACGNATTGIQTVSISDTLAPSFTVPADTTLYLDTACFVDTTTTSIGNGNRSFGCLYGSANNNLCR